MAKQIYIDENGNPIEVSGTVNTAELLPISGNDPTDTKSYIDNVVSSGSNTNGNWIKYADGTMICTKVQSIGVAQSDWSAWGSCYETDVKSVGSWAETFYNTPVCNAQVSGSGAWIENYYDFSTTSSGNIRFVRPSIPGGGITINLQIIAIGRWKA